MTPHRLHLILACVIIGSVELGCGRNPGNDGRTDPSSADLIAATERFVLHDAFEPPDGSLYYKPTMPPREIKEYALRHYDEDRNLRSIIAIYFLRYDAKLLSRGLMSADYRGGDLIDLLWEKEGARGFDQVESPGMSAMRLHIHSNAEWFGIDADGIKLLQKNEAALDSLVSTVPARTE